MYCRGRPRIRRVAAERSAPEGERVDESINAPTQETTLKPAQPTVPEGGNLNAAQMAELFLDRNNRNEVRQAAPRDVPVRQQIQGVSFHGPIARDRAQGRSLVRLLRLENKSQAEDSREVEPSPEFPVALVSPVAALVRVGHPEDSPVDHMLRPVYSQSPSRRLMLP
ncbi:hypothetical protein ACOSP7_026868 [Xanthoceras sorbifolium]